MKFVLSWQKQLGDAARGEPCWPVLITLPGRNSSPKSSPRQEFLPKILPSPAFWQFEAMPLVLPLQTLVQWICEAEGTCWKWEEEMGKDLEMGAVETGRTWRRNPVLEL